MEKEDLPQFAEWVNKPEVFGEHNPLRVMSEADAEKMLESPLELRPFIIEKKDRSKIGFITHFYELHVAGRRARAMLFLMLIFGNRRRDSL